MLQKIRYECHRWNVCADLKVTAMATVLQGRFTKFCCFKYTYIYYIYVYLLYIYVYLLYIYVYIRIYRVGLVAQSV